MSPLPSVPHAGIFASLTGKLASEFPSSSKSWVLAPCSCLPDAGGSSEPSAHTRLLVAASFIPFWFRRVSQFRLSIVTALQTQVSRVSVGHRTCPSSPDLARRVGPLSAGFVPKRVPHAHARRSVLVSRFIHGSCRATPPTVKRHTIAPILHARSAVGYNPVLGRAGV
jgi:hypothetical protein